MPSPHVTQSYIQDFLAGPPSTEIVPVEVRFDPIPWPGTVDANTFVRFVPLTPEGEPDAGEPLTTQIAFHVQDLLRTMEDAARDAGARFQLTPASPASNASYGILLDLPDIWSDEAVDDIIITAVEGGTGYWAAVRNYQHSGVQYNAGSRTSGAVQAWLEPDDEEILSEFEAHNLTLPDGQIGIVLDPDLVYRGIARMFGDRAASIPKDWLASLLTGDAGEVDAGFADVIVQYGAFGKEVFGP